MESLCTGLLVLADNAGDIAVIICDQRSRSSIQINVHTVSFQTINDRSDQGFAALGLHAGVNHLDGGGILYCALRGDRRSRKGRIIIVEIHADVIIHLEDSRADAQKILNELNIDLVDFLKLISRIPCLYDIRDQLFRTGSQEVTGTEDRGAPDNTLLFKQSNSGPGIFCADRSCESGKSCTDNDDIIVILSVFLNGFDCAAAPFGCVAACLGNCIRNCALNGSAGDGRTGYTVHSKGLCFYYLSRDDFQCLHTDTGSFVVFHNGDLCNLIILDRNLYVDRAVHALCRGRIGSVCHRIVFRPCARCGQGQKEAEENCQEFLHYDLLSHISIHRCLMIGDCRIAYVKHIRSLNNITLIKNKCNMKQKRIKNNGPLWDSHLTTGRHF